MLQIVQTESEKKHKKTQSFAFLIASILALLLCTFFLFFNTPKSALSNQLVLENKINPNYAPVSSLSRLPGIGLARANAIINYRRNFQKNNHTALPFISPNDLKKVKGIGPKTVESVKPFLKLQSNMP
ncbi:MAG: ComEA family DNA-binding protein [Planctomycetota bacterium]|jgi:competence ComEA-like helix-hairpin-helix protein